MTDQRAHRDRAIPLVGGLPPLFEMHFRGISARQLAGRTGHA